MVTNNLGNRAVVIGAGMSGLANAQALADHFEQVFVLERDELPNHATPRAGVPRESTLMDYSPAG